MKYPRETATGDAGEFFFAYQIASVLGWPCRLFDIDIGIDAQVEVVDDSENSTGRFVAFQVKTTKAGGGSHWYVWPRQLEYWRELELPVFVALVDLDERAMFLHRILLNHEYQMTDKGRVRIDFDRAKDRFSEKSRGILAKATLENGLEQVKSALLEPEERAREILAAVANPPADGPLFVEFAEQFGEIETMMHAAKALVSAYKVGRKECAAVSSLVTEARDELKWFILGGSFLADWDDHGNLQRFVDG